MRDETKKFIEQNSALNPLKASQVVVFGDILIARNDKGEVFEYAGIAWVKLPGTVISQDIFEAAVKMEAEAEAKELEALKDEHGIKLEDHTPGYWYYTTPNSNVFAEVEKIDDDEWNVYVDAEFENNSEHFNSEEEALEFAQKRLAEILKKNA